MIIFWTLAAGLMALAVLFVVVPLIRDPQAGAAPSQEALNLQVFRQRIEELDADRAAGFLDQARYEAARHDLERELLSDLGDAASLPGAKPKFWEGRAPILALVLSIALPTAAVLAYLQLGNGQLIPSLEAAAGNPAAGMEGSEAGAMASLEAMAQGLAAKLVKEPSNLDGWIMLGRTYASIGQSAKALDALEHAYKLAPRQADVIVAYAQALAVNAGNKLDGRPTELIRAALEIEPGNLAARSLGGMADFQEGRFAEAAKAWEGVLTEIDPASEDAAQMRQAIAEARTRGGLPGAAVSAPGPGPAQATARASDQAQAGPAPAGAEAPPASGTAATSGAAIRVKVSLSPELAATAAPGDTLFVFARAAEGPPMPLAVQRLKVSDLPATLTLDDSMAMMPAMRLSAFPKTIVGARISKSGQATPASGDLEGEAGPVSVADTPEVAVTIDRKRP